ncbi:fibroblast growth factor receptor 1 precursor, putative [Entamoeba invadens IP1]|uniref:Fibroblast growth factor receptor 1, putative n=1 Tax=Entamoeba invadens IP1 TaxID=370355 RepID=A0A0A1UBG2_ENTIV|nr:fibroblast growth factor receptor 1 precursor, putative [Entamoeba invadens IP1]ELP90997.1 fibroblast growth factor receptor 1 precursor, putative [Entamoeba invadens IP1]|eukprot:XP_004257768.1 fibroblast growth factor receptor 1 precursor, putative [Entamoeba invadens IP1]
MFCEIFMFFVAYSISKNVRWCFDLNIVFCYQEDFVCPYDNQLKSFNTQIVLNRTVLRHYKELNIKCNFTNKLSLSFSDELNSVFQFEFSEKRTQYILNSTLLQIIESDEFYQNNLTKLQNEKTTKMYTKGASCANGTYLNGQNCYYCDQSCQTCEDFSINNCNDCSSGYYKTNNSCFQCHPYCETCISNEQNSCLKCKPGFYLVDGSCYLCPKNCAACNFRQYCTKCKPTYYLIILENVCLKCKENCLTCTSKACSSCVDGYYLSGDVCKKCVTFCKTCQLEVAVRCTSCFEGYYLNFITGWCSPCNSSLCSICTDGKESSCVLCKENLYLSNGKCLKCDSTCKTCFGPNNDNCNSCDNNSYLINNTCNKCYSYRCYQCYNNTMSGCYLCQPGYYVSAGNCKQCSSNCLECTGFITCSTCNNGYYLNVTSNKCLPCYYTKLCASCSNSTSVGCTQCNQGYYLTTTRTCVACPLSCTACKEMGDITPTCTACYTPFYLKDGVCIHCDNNCKTCEDSSTTCTSCIDGQMYLNKNKCVACNMCSPSHCFSTGCSLCNKTNYYPDEFNCFQCDSSCLTCNGGSSKNCTSCKEGQYLMEGKCILCDSNCGENNCSSDMGCQECQNGYYPKNKICVPCSTINNCVSCSNSTEECIECSGIFVIENGICVCENGSYQNTTTTCDSCFNHIDNCQICESNFNDQNLYNNVSCKKCYPPYYMSNNLCISCPPGTYFENEMCHTNDANCQNQSASNECILCQSGYTLRNKKCEPFVDCKSESQIGCEECDYTINVDGKCTKPQNDCKYEINDFENRKCLQCYDGYLLIDETCFEAEKTNTIIQNNLTYTCDTQEYLNQNNMCVDCKQNMLNTNGCQLYNGNVISTKCDVNYVMDIINNKCIVSEMCLTYVSGDCVDCDNSVHRVIKNNLCIEKTYDKCVKYHITECIICEENYLISNGKCTSKGELNCENSNQFTCVKCEDNYHNVIYSLDEYCQANTDNIKFQKSTNNSTTILECSDNYLLSNNLCIQKVDKLNIKKSDDTLCTILTPKGCLKCVNGFYLDNSKNCVKCSNNCVECYNDTYCLSCNKTSNLFLTTNNSCQSLEILNNTCKLLMPTKTSCAICYDGYLRENGDCVPCDVSCATCLETKKCLTCKENYFLIQSESFLCQSYDNLTRCLHKTPHGCTLCDDGYYVDTQIPRCFKCDSNCDNCVTSQSCVTCSIDYILINNVCVSISNITHCIKATNNICTQCENDFKVSDNGITCVDNNSLNYGVVIGIPIASFILLVIIILLLIIIIYIISHKTRKEKEKEICIFNMKKSNISFTKLNDFLVSNLDQIKFENETNSDLNIPVDLETRALICIGNISKDKIKVQMSVVDGCELYSIRTSPPLVTLTKDEACEFEVFLKPNCSCCIKEQILCTSFSISKGVQTSTNIKISAQTILTTKLDYHELKEDKKLGEGSFGIVYLGTFRGNKVAIKKLKESSSVVEQFNEFENEVSMLDKFRSEYIVHFYGAVFIPNKVCMVTEFAPFGSLQDLIDKRKNSEERVPKNVRYKIMLDATLGLEYLHLNGVVHRDIKPDNILVFSLELMNDKVNGKLTDFGSARNINLLMTNMTFTKGVGTPKYMAPEVLNKEKYKMPCDIFSLGTSMYEVFSWKSAFTEKQFKYAWDIADFISAGKQLQKHENMTNSEFEIIKKMWEFEPQKRLKSGEIVSLLQKL